VRQALKENHNIEIPASTLLEENTIPLQMRYFSTQRFQTLIKNNCKVEIKFAKNTSKRQLKKGWLLAITVLLWLIKKSNNWGETRPEWGLKMQDLLSVERIN
jgi:uncharacterized protein YbcC (UPF0753/DUF2309 family)